MTASEAAIDAALKARDAGRGQDAIAPLRAALKRDPANARLWQTLGVVHRALEQSAAAATAFAEAARLAPADVKAAYGVAQASLEAGRAATALFDRAHALSPADGSILLGRAAAQLAEGRADAAIAGLDALCAASPLWLEGQAALAKLRWMMGEDRDFVAGYVRGLQAHPASAALWLALIGLLMHVEHWGQARAVIGRARALGVAQTALVPLEATCAAELGDVTAADALFATLGDDIATVESHVRHLLRTGRAEGAARRAGGALGDPDANRIWPYVGLAWRLTDDPRHAWLEGDPALVGVYELGEAIPSLTALAARLRTLHTAKRDPLGQSVRGGTQTDGPLFAHEAAEIQAVRAAVVDAVTRHAAALGPADPVHPIRRHAGKRFRFAGSWSVRLTGAGHHSPHVHPQGWLSSACYIALPTSEEMGPEPAGWLQLGQPPADLRLDLPPLQRIAPQPGRLVLFPSTMWHGTTPIAGGERLTIAFDVTPIG